MLINPSNLYGGAAVKFDSSDATNYYLNQKAKEDAKADALDKYFATLTDKANAAGMRADKEGPAFYKAVQNYQDFFNKNRKELSSGRNYQLQSQAQQLAKIPFQIAEDSKSILASTKQVGAMIGSNPENRQRLSAYTIGHDEDGKPTTNPLTGGPTGLAANEQPKWIVNADGSVGINPLHQTIDANALSYNPQRMSAKQIEDALSSAAEGIDYDEEKITTEKDPSRKYGIIETSIKSFKPETLGKVGNNAGRIYEDPTVQYNWNLNHPYQKWISDDTHKQEFASLNKLFKDIYGRDISNSKEHFQAAAMAKNNISKKEAKAGIDLDAQWNARNAKEYQQRVAIANMTKITPQQQAEGNAFDDLSDADLPSGYKIRNGQILDQNNKPYTSPTGTKDVHLDLKHIPAQVLASLKASGIDPDYLYKGADIEVKDGRILNMSNKYIPNVSRTGMKVFQGNYKKPKNKAPFDPQ